LDIAKKVKTKVRRVRWIWKYLNPSSQKILTETYVKSRIRYAIEIIFSYISKSKRNEIESIIRSMQRIIHGYQ